MPACAKKDCLNQFKIMPIHMRVLFSSITGILVACIFVQPFTSAAFQYFQHDNPTPPIGVIWSMLFGPVIFPFALVVTAPLIGITILIALIFRKSIEKHLIAWCCMAPVSVWLFETTYLTLTRDNAYYQSHTFIENFLTTITNPGNFLYLFGPAPAALIFYLISANSPAPIAEKNINEESWDKTASLRIYLPLLAAAAAPATIYTFRDIGFPFAQLR